MAKKPVWKIGLKMVRANKDGTYESPGWGHAVAGLKYTPGRKVVANGLSRDRTISCGQGINLSDGMKWIESEHKRKINSSGYAILFVKYDANKAVIPYGGKGKFRVREGYVLKEKPLIVPAKYRVSRYPRV